MQTQLLPVTDAALEKAAEILREGGLVAFPTETVYGLGANALNPEAVAAIFAAKGRPADNPLIAHICDTAQLDGLVRIPDAAPALMEAFWPGPLTILMPRTSAVPDVVTAGLDTVAIRMPSHPVAQAMLRACGLPVAAPSANRSGKPSPTTAAENDALVLLIWDTTGCSTSGAAGSTNGIVTTSGDAAAKPPAFTATART